MILYKKLTIQGYVYEGNWENDRMQGQGRLSMPDGSVFEGQFQNGKFHGHGTYCWSDGSRYEGRVNEPFGIINALKLVQ